MTNHHLLVETPDANLSRGMRQLNGVYTQRFNRSHQRVGLVFQGRYKAILVQEESYLLELARYVVLNPVRAHMVKGAGDWPWSNYRATTGTALAPEWLQTVLNLRLRPGRSHPQLQLIPVGIILLLIADVLPHHHLIEADCGSEVPTSPKVLTVEVPLLPPKLARD